MRFPTGPTGLGATGLLSWLRPEPKSDPMPEPTPEPMPDPVSSLVSNPVSIAAAEPGESACDRPPFVPAAARPDRLLPTPLLERDWGDGTNPPLLLPSVARVDDALAAEVDDRLAAWAEATGLHTGRRLDEFRSTGFGRLMTLVHPESDDPDLILVSAQLNSAWWASDDYYADETELGADAHELPGRLALVTSALDPPPDAGEFTDPLQEAIRSDPVLVALRSAIGHAARHATPSQLMRIRNTTSQMYVSWNAYNAWREAGLTPPAWRYLAARQHDSFYTSMILIDIVGGYHLPADEFADPGFHRTLMQAGTAAVIVNDLLSAEREARDERPDCNLVLLLAEERGWPLRRAVEAVVELHNRFVRDFEAGRLEAEAFASPWARRFLLGARAWMAGGFEWHETTSRYKG